MEKSRARQIFPFFLDFFPHFFKGMNKEKYHNLIFNIFISYADQRTIKNRYYKRSNTGPSFEVTNCEAIRICPPINGGWTEWSKWSGCSKSCGKGQIIRSRTCTNPFPENGGKKCYGDSIQNRPCYLKKCQNLDAFEVRENQTEEQNTQIVNKHKVQSVKSIHQYFRYFGKELSISLFQT